MIHPGITEQLGNNPQSFRYFPPRRGISKNYSQQMIFQILDVACGSQRSYNFVHLPKRGDGKFETIQECCRLFWQSLTLYLLKVLLFLSYLGQSFE